MFKRFTHGDDGKDKKEELPLTGGVPEPLPSKTLLDALDDGWAELAPGRREFFTKFRDEEVVICSLTERSNVMYFMPPVMKHLHYPHWITVLVRNHQIALIGAPDEKGYKVGGVEEDDKHRTAFINITKLVKKYNNGLQSGAYPVVYQGNLVVIDTRETPIPVTR